MYKRKIRSGEVGRGLIIAGILFSVIYISWWFRLSNADNKFLYFLLFIGEIYHFIVVLMFFHTIWPKGTNRKGLIKPILFTPSVDIFITVAGEPASVVRDTILGAKKQNYPNYKIYVLNDGKALKKDNWTQIRDLTDDLGVGHIARDTNDGYKAGNINNALKLTGGELVAILDADMVPDPEFLKSTVGFFMNESLAFVQTPQYYKNKKLNEVTAGSWEQQEFFFGPIMKGKNSYNAAFMCGTNLVIRKTALLSVGGMREDNIAEDFVTSQYIHENGWKSIYLDRVLAYGLAPEDPASYFKQQLRWARGALEMFFNRNPLFSSGLKIDQKTEYLSSSLFYLSGIVVMIDALMPLTYLFFGIQPVKVATTDFAFYFLPFITLTLYMMYAVSEGSFTFRALSFSFSSWFIHLNALISILLNRKMAFLVTPKKGISGNYNYLAYPHLIYIFLFFIGALIGVSKESLSPGVTTNLAWGTFNSVLFIPYIRSVINYKNGN